MPRVSFTLLEYPLIQCKELQEWTDGLGRLGVSHLFTHHPANLGYSLTVKGPWPLSTGRDLHFLPWWSEATLAIWSERLVRGPYKKNSSEAQTCNPGNSRLFTSEAILNRDCMVRFISGFVLGLLSTCWVSMVMNTTINHEQSPGWLWEKCAFGTGYAILIYW